MIKQRHPFIKSALIALAFVTTAYAGPFGDALGRKLVTSTSEKDRMVLVRWMYTAMSQHSAIKDMSSVTPEQITQTNKEVGQLFERLLTKDCQAEAKLALKHEGFGAISGAFKILGSVAGKEIFNDPNVSKGMGELEKNVDFKAIEKALK